MDRTRSEHLAYALTGVVLAALAVYAKGHGAEGLARLLGVVALADLLLWWRVRLWWAFLRWRHRHYWPYVWQQVRYLFVASVGLAALLYCLLELRRLDVAAVVGAGALVALFAWYRIERLWAWRQK